MSEHARLSLSHSDLWMGCAAWPRIVAEVGEETTPEIEFGNVSHDILEDMLLNTFVENKTLTEEAECAKETYDFVMAEWEKLGYGEAVCMAEAQLKITSTGRDDLWGSADVILYTDEILHVIDHKTGQGTFVDEKTSNQLKHYAVAAIDTQGLNPVRIALTISQPRYWGDEPKQRTYVMTKDELMVWLATQSVPAATATDDPNAIGTVTERCKKCAGRHVCEYRDDAVARGLTNIAGKPDTPGALQTTMGVTEMAIRDHQDLTIYDNEHLSDVLLLVPVIRDYCDALEEHAQEIIMKGEQVPFFKVVATGGRSNWTDEEAVKAALYKTKVAKDAYKQTLKTPKQVLSLVPKTNKKLAAKLNDLIGKSSGGLALVMETDERESAAPQFKDLTANVNLSDLTTDGESVTRTAPSHQELPPALIVQNPVEVVPEEQPDGAIIDQEIPAELPAFLL